MENEKMFERGNWMIDIWNCHGVLKKEEWGVGKDYVPNLNKEKIKMENIGYFSIPVPVGEKLSKKQKKAIEEVLFNAVNREGAINMSGFYSLLECDLNRLKQAYKGTIKKAKTSELVKKVIERLRDEKNHALRAWSSAWNYGCYSGCQGFHEETYIYYDGKRFKKFFQGYHHAYYQGMWNISPKTITQKEVEEAIRNLVKHERKEDEVYNNEIDEFVENFMPVKIGFCKKHSYYFDSGYGCESCRQEKEI
ncbi:MAG: hypothetical protein QME47_06015 [Candidatus Thermoplasmatota archaeon]|nr:hypothetical protein [Candidatus Thermoplasmatota archaeon]